MAPRAWETESVCRTPVLGLEVGIEYPRRTNLAKAVATTGSGCCMPAYVFSRVAVLTIALPLLCSFGLCQVNQEKAAAYSDKGLQLAQAGDLPGAESELRRALTLAPRDSELLTNLGTVLAMEKKLKESTEMFDKALALAPGNLTARRYLAASLWQLHRYPEARRNLEQILNRKPDDAASRLLLGMVAENTKDYATAARMLSSVPDEVRKQPESVAALARSYYHLGAKGAARDTLAELQNHPAGTRAVLLGTQIADEMADYDTALQLLLPMTSRYPDQPDWGYRVATVQYHAQRFAESEQTLLRLIAAGNGNGQIFNLLGWCYQKQGRSEQAIHAFEDGVGHEPGEETNYLDLEEALVAEGRLAAALEVAKRATDALANSPRAFLMRGSLEMKASQFSNAVASYRRARQLDPSAGDALLGLADAEFSADMRKEAHTSFEAGIQQFPKDARFPLHYALVLLKEAETGDSTGERPAEELLQSALKLDPSSVEAHCRLGELALKKGHTNQALYAYQRAAKLDPRSAKAHFGLSRVYRRLGRVEEASRETQLFQQLQQSEPNSSPRSPSSAGPQE